MRFLTIVVILFTIFTSPVRANDVISVDRVVFLGEYNGGGSSGTWTQLRFSVIAPKRGFNRIYSNNRAEFTIDSSFRSNFLRTDLRYRNDWLGINRFDSSKKSDMYVGSGKPTLAQRNDLRKLTTNERFMAAWIIANTDELIEFALRSKKYIPERSRKRWKYLGQNDRFESNIRKNLGPFYRTELSAYDQHAKHTKLALERMIQPNLKKLGFYDGKIDGLWGGQTKSALMEFELKNNLFPDGVNYGDERKLLVSQAAEIDQYSDISAIKKREEKLKKGLDYLNKQLEEQRKKTREAEEKAKAHYRDVLRLNKIISDLKKDSLNSDTRSRLLNEINSWRQKASKQEDLAKRRYDQVISLNKKISELETEINSASKSNLADNERSKLISELTAWRDKSTKQKELAQSRYAQILSLNKKISDLKKLLDDADTASKTVETLNEKAKKLETELQEALRLQTTEAAKYRKLESDLKRNHRTEMAKLEAALEKQISDLKTELEEVERGTAGLPKFKLDEEWVDFERFLAVQQVRFCQILLNYEEEAENAAESRNQLRQNLVATNRDNDIAALLPNGNYKDWVAKVVEIYATPSGDAAFVLRLPCDVTFGSGQLPQGGGSGGEYAATAEFGGIIYNQLAQLAEGDTVLISGKILTYADIGNTTQRLNFVTTLVNNKQIKSSPTKERFAPDYFSSVVYLSKL